MPLAKKILGTSLVALAALSGVVFFDSAPNTADALAFTAATAPANCTLDCTRVHYVPYLVNPNGSIRMADNPKHAQSFVTPEGLEVIRMEDSNIDNNYRDVELVVDRSNCEQIKITVALVRGLYHHKIGVKIFYDSTLIHDVILWNDSHAAVGETKTVLLREAEAFETYCVVPPVASPAIEAPSSSSCSARCNAAGLYMYIVNPDGSERHTDSLYAQTHRKGPRQFDIYFDDSGSDFDYNDVMLAIDAQDCGAMRARVIHSLALWHHQIRARVVYNNVTVSNILLWEDSHDAVGQEKTVNVYDYLPMCSE